MNLRRLSIAVLGVTVLVGSLALCAVTANATVLYDYSNFEGDSYSAESSWYVGSMNDRASSVTLGRDDCYVFFENYGYAGRRVVLCDDYNSLGAVSTGLHWWENWGDRISSYF